MLPIEQIKDKIINTVKNNQITIISASTGVGKAMPLDTNILTPSGWKLLKDIHVNDIVYDEDGEETKVINEFSQGKKQVYEITFTDNTKIKCCKDHLWKVSVNNSEWKVLSVQEILNNYQLIDIQNNYLLSIPLNKPIQFNKKYLQYDPYEIGLSIQTTNIDLYNYIHSSINERIKLLQGIIASCGNINNYGYIVLNFINDDIMFLIRSLGYRFRKNNNTIVIYNNTDELLTLIKHKNEFYNRIKTSLIDRIFIKSIHATDQYEEMKCIRVDSNKHTFICQDFIVTHNSSYIPYLLYKELGLKTVVTQPRRLACTSLTDYVRSLLPEEEKNIVGYKTGLETDYNEETNKILYVTDGILAVHGLTDTYQVFIIDEIHEWSLNIEVVLSYLKERLQKFKSHPERYFKVILMSATINVDELKLFFFNFNPQTIEFKYEPYPIQVIEKNSSILSTIYQYYQKNNLLVFLPGKKEIEELYEDVSKLNNVKVFILHGDQTLDEQKVVFQHYKEKKLVLSTNVCQTSITIDDIDVVIDTGLVKQVEVINGIKGLYTVDISQSDCIQRKGRAGRTKPGTYILCSNININKRPASCVPEIKRMPLEDVVLRLLSMRLDIFKMNFIHKPPEKHIKDAIKLLYKLELILDNTTVTPLGKEVTMIPLNLRYAIMLLESKKYGRNVFDSVAKICAIMQANGLLRYDKHRGRYSDFSNEKESDLIAELNIFNWIQNKINVNWQEKGLNEKHYLKAQEYLNKILELDNNIEDVKSINVNNDIKKCILVGHKDALYTNIPNSIVHNDEIDFTSCIKDTYGCFVGIPRYVNTKLIVSNATHITEKLYTDIFGKESIQYEMDAYKNNQQIIVNYLYAYAERNNTRGVFWIKDYNDDIDPELIAELWNREHKDDIIRMFSINDIHFYIKTNLTDEIINLDNEPLLNNYILIMNEDFEYYNLFKLFNEVDHSQYQFILNINTRLITLGRGYTYHDDEQLERAFNRINPIYIASKNLQTLKDRLELEKQKQQQLVDNMKKRLVKINNKMYRIECIYIDNVPQDLTIKDKKVNKKDSFFKKENIDNIVLEDPIYYINISVDDLYYLRNEIIFNGHKVVICHKKTYVYNPLSLHELFENDISRRLHIIKKKADKQAELKTRSLLQKDRSMVFSDHVHPVKFKKGQYYIEINVDAINKDCYKDIHTLNTNGTQQPILFKCKDYSNYDLAELIKEVNNN